MEEHFQLLFEFGHKYDILVQWEARDSCTQFSRSRLEYIYIENASAII
jgi:hypothetical protein